MLDHVILQPIQAAGFRREPGQRRHRHPATSSWARQWRDFLQRIKVTRSRTPHLAYGSSGGTKLAIISGVLQRIEDLAYRSGGIKWRTG